MELDHGRGHDLDLDLPVDELPDVPDGGFGPPPPPAAPERPDPWGGRPDPVIDTWRITLGIAGVVLVLGLLKLGLFLVGGALGSTLLGAVFVVAHAVVIAGGGAWFGGYRRDA